MIPILTMGYAEQQTVDRVVTERMEMSLYDLMLRASRAVAVECRSWIQNGYSSVTVFAGPGNNGGDAYTVARLLAEDGTQVRVMEALPERNRSPLAAFARTRMIEEGVPVLTDAADIPSDSLLVDGIFGAGFRVGRSIDPGLQSLLEQINQLHRNGSAVIAIDVPSGAEADTGRIIPSAVHADTTVTFVRAKHGLLLHPGRICAGRIVVDDLGVSASMIEDILRPYAPAPELLETDTVSALCPARPADGHKGRFGRVLLTGGSPGMTGAIRLATYAALRSGAGLVYAMVPEASRAGLEAGHPEALIQMLKTFPPDRETLLTMVAGMEAVAAGPGLYPDEAACDMIGLLIAHSPGLVLDAGALSCVAQRRDSFFPLLKEREADGLPMAILTPHPGEFKRMSPELDVENRLESARALAAQTASVVVLKGAGTVIAMPDGQTAINSTGNSGMATGGTGDVLCGLTAGLLAQGMSPWDAARAAVFLHGLAGDVAAETHGKRAMIAGDLVDCFHTAFMRTGWEQEVGLI